MRRHALWSTSAIGLTLVVLVCALWAPEQDPIAPAGPSRGSGAPIAHTDSVDRVADSSSRLDAGPLPAPDDAASVAPIEAREPAATWIGRVVDAEGAPLSDVLVLAGTQASERLGRLDSSAQERAEDAADPCRALTDAHGRFRLQGLEAGFARLALRRSGYVARDVERLFVVGRAEEQQLGDLALERAPRLELAVVDPQGEPVAHAEVLRVDESLSAVVLLPDPGGRKRVAHLATTDAQGRCVLDTLAWGPWALRVEHADFTAELLHGTLERGAAADPLTVLLTPGETIAGFVRGESGRSLERLEVQAAPVGGSPGAASLSAAVRPGDGGFELRGLPGPAQVESWLLAIGYAGGAGRGLVRLSEGVAVRAGTHDAILHLPALAEFELRAVDASSGAELAPDTLAVEVVRDGRIEALDRRSARPAAGPGSTVAGPFALPGGAARWRVTIDVAGHASEVFEGLQPAPGTWDLGRVEFAARPRLRVLVVAAEDGSPVAGARVAADAGESATLLLPHRDGGVQARSRRGGERTRALSDAAGRAALELPEGAGGRVAVRHPGFAPAIVTVADWSASGELRVELARGNRLRATVRAADGSPAAGAGVDLGALEGTGLDKLVDLDLAPRSYEVTDERGQAEFHALPAGVYTLCAYAEPPGGGGGEPVVVELSGDLAFEVDLELVRRARLEGRVTLHGVAAEGVSVRAVPQGLLGERLYDPVHALPAETYERRSGPGGEFAFEALELGDYSLHFDAGPGAALVRRELELTAAGERLQVELFGGVLRGHVRSVAGAALTDVCLSLCDPQEVDACLASACPHDGGAGHSAGDGSFELALPAAGAVVVLARAHGFQPARSAPIGVAQGGSVQQLELELSPGARLTVNVLHADGSPAGPLDVYEVRATWSGSDAPDLASVSRWPSRTASVLFEGLQPGTWTVEVLGFSSDETDRGSKVVELSVDRDAVLDWRLP